MQGTVYHYFGNWREQLISAHPRNRVTSAHARAFFENDFLFSTVAMRATGAWPMPNRNRAQAAPHRCFSVEYYDFSGARISKHVRDQRTWVFSIVSSFCWQYNPTKPPLVLAGPIGEGDWIESPLVVFLGGHVISFFIFRFFVRGIK